MYKNHRNIYENGIYHIFNRGVDKQAIFKSARDYEYFVNRFWFYQKITGIHVLSYCLLPNHYHLLLQEPTNPGLQPWVGVNQYKGFRISKFVGLLSHSYTKYFNTKYDRSGRLFEYVFKSREINNEKELSVIIDYICFNPIKHRLVKDNALWKYYFINTNINLDKII